MVRVADRLAVLSLALLVAAAAAGPPAPVAAADATAAAAEPAAVPRERRGSGLPVPRFAALRSEEINVRTGPGTRYPVEWIYNRKGLPVEVVAEFDTWRKIRDWQGGTGWVHQSMLVGKRSVVVMGKAPQVLRSDPDAQAGPVAQLEPGVIGELMSCPAAWCRVRAGGQRGWLPRTVLWGIYANEAVE